MLGSDLTVTFRVRFSLGLALTLGVGFFLGTVVILMVRPVEFN